MSSRNLVRPFPCVALALVALATSGCNPLAAIYFLFLLPPPKVPAAYEGLKKKHVVVVAYATREAQFEYPAIDSDLAKKVGQELRQNVDGIKLADPSDVRQWLDEHSGFEPSDLGREFKAERVVYLEIESFGLFEERSTDLYRGRAKVRVQVVDMEQDGDTVWETVVDSTFPGSRPIMASEMSREKFRILFMAHLRREVARNFFGYRPDENFTVN